MLSMQRPAKNLVCEVLELPTAERLALGQALVEDVVCELTSAQEDRLNDVGSMAELRAALVSMAPVLDQIARSADTALHALCARHREVVRQFDLACREHGREGELGVSEPGEYACDDLAPRLRRTSARIERMAQDADLLQKEHPDLWAACARGESVVASCRVMRDEVQHLAAADRSRALEALTEAGIHQAWPNAVRWRARRLLARLELSKPRETADSTRHVGLRFEENPHHSDLTDMYITLESDRAWRVRAAIDARARELTREPETRRSAAEDFGYPKRLARVDAFVELLLDQVALRADLTLCVPVDVTGKVSSRDVHVPGIGTIGGEVVDALATSLDPQVRVSLTQGTHRGTSIWSSTETYRPTAAIRRLVILRDEHCRFPGCARPSPVCDIDHVVPHTAGGLTAAGNLQLLCRHHHRAKTHGGWQITMTEDGTCEWRGPDGACYTTRPGDAGLHTASDISTAA